MKIVGRHHIAAAVITIVLAVLVAALIKATEGGDTLMATVMTVFVVVFIGLACWVAVDVIRVVVQAGHKKTRAAYRDEFSAMRDEFVEQLEKLRADVRDTIDAGIDRAVDDVHMAAMANSIEDLRASGSIASVHTLDRLK